MLYLIQSKANIFHLHKNKSKFRNIDNVHTSRLGKIKPRQGNNSYHNWFYTGPIMRSSNNFQQYKNVPFIFWVELCFDKQKCLRSPVFASDRKALIYCVNPRYYWKNKIFMLMATARSGWENKTSSQSSGKYC